MEADKTSSNRTTTMSIINPDYNIEIADSEQRLTVSLFDYLTANNGVMPTDYNIVIMDITLKSNAIFFRWYIRCSKHYP
jgi:hypothetical protein